MVDFFPGAARSRTINLEKEHRVFEEKRLALPPRSKMGRDALEWLVVECGGSVVASDNESDFPGASEQWILDAIEKFKVPKTIY